MLTGGTPLNPQTIKQLLFEYKYQLNNELKQILSRDFGGSNLSTVKNSYFLLKLIRLIQFGLNFFQRSYEAVLKFKALEFFK